MIRSLLPRKVKLTIHLFRHALVDLMLGYTFQFAKSGRKHHHYTGKIRFSQDLKPNPAKRHNLQIAQRAIESVHIMPGEIFSFWKAVGTPTKKNGFKESRSIIGDRIDNSVGGGLCQLSGLIYYVSLIANLDVIERHPHSADIYTEDTRFTPLGSDATVVYGYKDLRIRNNRNSPIQVTFIMEEELLSIDLNYTGEIEENEVWFEQKNINETQIKVDTLINGTVKNTSVYKKYVSDQKDVPIFR
jgi:vancomycin resistance protein VanW